MYKIEDRFGNPAATVTTTDATQTVVDSFTLDDETCCLVRITVVATESGGGNRAATEQIALVYRDGGAATVEGAVVIIFEEYSNGSWAVNITVSSNDVRVSVTGVAATTINWKCAMQFIEQ